MNRDAIGPSRPEQQTPERGRRDSVLGNTDCQYFNQENSNCQYITLSTPDEAARRYAEFWQSECHRLRAALGTATEHAGYWVAIASLAEQDGDG